MTCRCTMCGVKNVGMISRKYYVEVRLIGDESRKHSAVKDKTRKIRRVREKRIWMKEIK